MCSHVRSYHCACYITLGTEDGNIRTTVQSACLLSPSLPRQEVGFEFLRRDGVDATRSPFPIKNTPQHAYLKPLNLRMRRKSHSNIRRAGVAQSFANCREQTTRYLWIWKGKAQAVWQVLALIRRGRETTRGFGETRADSEAC